MKTYAISGHQRAPQAVWSLLATRLPDIFGDPPFAGVASLAAGADQRFAETVLSHGGNLRVVIPSRNYESSFKHAGDLITFSALLAEASEVEILDFSKPGESAFLAAGVRVVNLCDTLVAVWDGLPAEGKGGTADVVAYARSVGKPVEVVWPSGVQR